jgi:hypothetical protein
MRSRKLVRAPEAIRTTIWPDTTSVPPETQVRTPSASQITGADSPVMADSSIDAPCTISPSPGMTCPAFATTRSPGLNLLGFTSSISSAFGQTIGNRPTASLAERTKFTFAMLFSERGHKQEILNGTAIFSGPPFSSGFAISVKPLAEKYVFAFCLDFFDYIPLLQPRQCAARQRRPRGRAAGLQRGDLARIQAVSQRVRFATWLNDCPGCCVSSLRKTVGSLRYSFSGYPID